MRLKHSAIIALAGILTAVSCAEETRPGIDPSAVPPTGVTYDDVNSSSTALGFYWEVDDAIAAGAVSFTAQIVKDHELGGNVYTGANSQTLQASASPNDGIVFNGLTENSKYYARVRANYPRSVFSEWVYVMNDAGERAVIKLGLGIVDESIQAVTGATARLVDVSPSTAVVEWSVTDFSNLIIDQAALASLELYSDEDCSDLVVSWDIDNASFTTPVFTGQPRFIFSGLTPGTDYWFTVECRTATEDGLDVTLRSEPLKFTTEAAKAVFKKTGTAQPGEVIIFQDFSELIWGGDAVNQAAGYSAEKRSSVTSLQAAKGWNPIGGDYGYYICTPSTEMGLYNSIQKALAGSGTSLAQWAELREDLSVVGMVCGRPGSVKVGASSKVGALVTPALSTLSGTATVELRFKASPYGSSQANLDPLGACIRLLDGTTVSGNIVTAASTNIMVKEFNLKNDLALDEYVFTIPNVTPTSRLAIGGYRAPDETGQHRMVLDDISVKVLSYGETAFTVETPVIQLSAGEGQIRVDWAACENATSYDVQYKLSSASEWKNAGNTTYTYHVIRGLMPEVSYDVRVKAKYSDKYTSEWSAVASITTPHVNKTINISAPVVTAGAIGFKWYTDSNYASDILTPYRLELYKGSELVTRLSLDAYGVPDTEEMTVASTDRPQLWTASSGPRFLFTGLQPSTTYELVVTNKDINISASLEVSTAASQVVTIPSGKAAAGDVVLFEDFSQLLWGGLPALQDFDYGFPGFSSSNRSSLGSFVSLTGEQPLASSANKLYLAAANTQYGLLNTTWRATATTRLKDWGAISESYTGDAAGSLCGEPGLIKLGAAGAWCQILTPALSCLSGTATVKVSFLMAPYTDNGVKASDPLDAVVKVLDGVTLSTVGNMRQAYSAGTVSYEKTFTLADRMALQKFEFTIPDVKPGARIAIGTYRNGDASGQRRAFLNDVKIEIVKYQ